MPSTADQINEYCRLLRLASVETDRALMGAELAFTTRRHDASEQEEIHRAREHVEEARSYIDAAEKVSLDRSVLIAAAEKHGLVHPCGVSHGATATIAAQHLVGFADSKLTAAALVAEQIEAASAKDAELLRDIATRIVNVPERPLDLPGEIERLRIAALSELVDEGRQWVRLSKADAKERLGERMRTLKSWSESGKLRMQEIENSTDVLIHRDDLPG